MRELKYRLYDKYHKRYIAEYWNYAIKPDGYLIELTKYDDEVGHRVNNASQDDYAIEQYTGLKDKNGKEIYEGDIVRYAIRPSRTTVVEWWSGEEEYYPCCTTSGFALPYSEDGYEVIGNIHENPELLNRKEKE